jgi:hypothetical protein
MELHTLVGDLSGSGETEGTKSGFGLNVAFKGAPPPTRGLMNFIGGGISQLLLLGESPCLNFASYVKILWVISQSSSLGDSSLCLNLASCKGNLTDLRRILHLSLAKGNPKRML